VPVGGPGADGEGEAEEDEALGRGVDLGLHREVLAIEPGAVDAEVGDGRRVGQAEGDPDGVAGAAVLVVASTVVSFSRAAK